MTGQDCVVVGCGPSAEEAFTAPLAPLTIKAPPVDSVEFQELTARLAAQARGVVVADATDVEAVGPRSRWTLACNRAVSLASPDFGVCLEPFRDAAWPIMRKANPLICFSHICTDRLGKKAFPRTVKIKSKDVMQWFPGVPERPDGKRTLTVGQAPFFAIACALWLGFETIGIIGVDLTEDRYPDPTPFDVGYGHLNTIARSLKSRLLNLNPESRLTAIPKGTWEEIRTK